MRSLDFFARKYSAIRRTPILAKSSQEKTDFPRKNRVPYNRKNTVPSLSGQNLDVQWQTALQTAIRIGNDMHDELFDGQGINVTVEDAISAVGNHCQVQGILQEFNIFGANPVDKLETVIQTLL